MLTLLVFSLGHGRFGSSILPSSSCRRVGCDTKKFVDSITISDDGYPLYRRKDNGRTTKMGDLLNDNRFVVPCNKYLLLRYNAHINAKWCNQSRFIKHLFKYFNKGQDHDTATFYQSATDEQQRCMDEIKKLYYNCR